MIFKQVIAITALASVFSLGINLFSPNSIPCIGKYRSLHSGKGPIVPPEVELGDPPFIAVDLAELEFSSGSAVFVDSREPWEFECGTIPESINIPFDCLPEGDLKPYFDSTLGGISTDNLIVVFCSGEECDLSLHLVRNLQYCGYTNLAIFYGGAREWEKFNLPMQRSDQCIE